MNEVNLNMEENQIEPDTLQEEVQTVEESEIAPENLPSELDMALAKQEEYLNLAQRVQADFENYKKRNVSIRKDAYDDGKKDFAQGILPILDNFERAIQSADDEQDPLLIGIKMVYRQILDLLEKNNIETISRQGEVFDPELEEAVSQGNPEDGEPGTVCEVLQKGYKMNKFVLRHSMVKVVPQ